MMMIMMTDLQKKGGLLSRFKGKDYDDNYDDDYDDYDDRAPRSSSRNSQSSSHAVSNAGNNKVTPMRQPASRRNAPNMEVCVIKPSSVEDAREITETLLSGRTVILNLEAWILKWHKGSLILHPVQLLLSAAICRRFPITYSLLHLQM